jgi:hypothetical protein
VLGVGWLGSRQGALFEGEVGVQVDLGGVDPLMPEAQGDDGGVDAGVQDLHRGGVPEGVQGDLLLADARAASRCCAEVFGESAFSPSRLSRLPRWVGNSGLWGSPARSASQTRRTATVTRVERPGAPAGLQRRPSRLA